MKEIKKDYSATKFSDNFVLLRLLMSLIVMVTHFKVLSNGELMRNIPFSGQFAVSAFFVISGYVIVASYDKFPVLLSFYSKRFFRMYPLYAFVIILQVIVMCFFVDDIWSNLGNIFRYFFFNMLMLNFLQPDLGNLTANLPVSAINPSLWTLKIEVMFYAIVPLLCYCFARFRLWGFAVLFIVSSIYAEYMLNIGNEIMAKQLPGSLRFIIIGAALYYYRKKLPVPFWIAVPVCIIGFVVLEFDDNLFHPIIYPFIVGPLIMMAAVRFPNVWRPKSDLSYGVYMFHAPVIQLTLITGIFQDTYWFLGLLIIFVCGISWLGYKFIELPGVKLGEKISKYAAMKAPSRPPQKA